MFSPIYKNEKYGYGIGNEKGLVLKPTIKVSQKFAKIACEALNKAANQEEWILKGKTQQEIDSIIEDILPLGAVRGREAAGQAVALQG